MCLQAGIDGQIGHFTNHSLKRSARSILCSDGFGRDLVIKKTGHVFKVFLKAISITFKLIANGVEMNDLLNFVATMKSEPITEPVATTLYI